MKIKGKLLAGGLMTAIACGLVGSITGTFAWYQISNQSTVSMHGASVGSSQNLQLAWSASAPDTGEGAWSTENLSWSDIKTHATKKGSGTNNDELLPASNGSNAGQAALNDTWYTNPTGGASLPEVPKTSNVYNDGYFVQFTFYARYQEYTSSTATYPAARIYVDEIASKAITATQNVSFALRMHVQMGDSTYFIVNPYDTAAKNVTLSSTYKEVASQYDWTDPAGTRQTVGLPSADNPGTLSTLAHSSVVSTFNTDGSLATAGKYVETSGASGVAITVTFWLEGFAQQQEGTSETQIDSDWWDAPTTVGTVLDFGFQLRGIKN